MGLDLVPIRPKIAQRTIEVVECFFANLEIGIGAFATCDIRLGHQLTFDSRPAAGVHYCLEGRGELRLRGGSTVPMQPHSFVLLPPNVVYTLGANENKEPSTPRGRLRAPLFKESVPTIQAGEGEAGIITVCGEVRFDGIGAPGLFAQLGEPMVEHFDGPVGLREHFIILLAESARPRFGTRPLTEALLKQCLILLMRRKIESGASPLPWMAALADPGLSAAMQAILQRFSEPLTVESLASIAGMSRSSFAAQFTQCFDRTPMSLLRSVRLCRARELLATSNASIEQIASCVGFSSRSNFSRSFCQVFGVDPSTYRTNSLVNPERLASTPPAKA
jgi:AraC family transcriptional activator of mtrCDE